MSNSYYEEDYEYVDEDLYKVSNDNTYKITNKNDAAIKRIKNKFICKIALVGIISTSILITSKIVNTTPTLAPSIPDGYMQIYIEEMIEPGEKLQDITSKYYTENESLYYRTYKSFVKSVEERNNIEYENIHTKTSITIPVIIENDNYYYQTIQELENAIKTKEEWVSYKIDDGDTLYKLAWMGAGNGDEANINVEKIKIKNGLDDDIIQVNKTIYIINPEIGDIRKEIESLRSDLYQYITSGNEKVKTK